MNAIITPKMLRDINRVFFWLERAQLCGCGNDCNRHVSFWKEGTRERSAALTFVSNPN